MGVLLNVPSFIMALLNFNIFALYQFANLICATCAIPATLGVIPYLETRYNYIDVLVGCISGLTCTLGYAGGSSGGIYDTFFLCFCYQPFLVATTTSLAGSLLSMCIQNGIKNLQKKYIIVTDK